MEETALKLFQIVCKAASPEIINNFQLMVQEILDRAKATENPWDDIFAMLLQMAVGKPGETQG